MNSDTSPAAKDKEERARIVAASALAVLALLALVLMIGAPRRVPPLQPQPGLDITDIARFRRDSSACVETLRQAQIQVTPIPATRRGGACTMRNAVEVNQSLHPYSQPLAASCPLAAALVVWERDVVIPAAERRLGARIARIEMAAPAYQCRPIAGREDRRLSEHATANGIDISGFTLVNGRVITVKDGWRGREVERVFLRQVRDGACQLFQGVLSPDYNAAHRDHFHFDLGRDKMCR